MDNKAFPVIIMNLTLVSVACNGRKLCHQIHALYQRLIHTRIIWIFIIIIKGQNCILKLIHQILSRKTQQVHLNKIIWNGIAQAQDAAELFQLRLLWKIAEKKQKANLLITEMASLFSLNQIQHINSTVQKPAGNGLDSILCFLISHYVCNSGKAYSNASTILISKALFHIVFLVPFIRNVCIILRFSIKLRQITFLYHRCAPFLMLHCLLRL